MDELLLMFVFEGPGLQWPFLFFVLEGEVFIILNSPFCLYEKIKSIFLNTNNGNSSKSLSHDFKQFCNAGKVYPVEGRLQKC